MNPLSETHLSKDTAPAANTCLVRVVSCQYSTLQTSPELTALPVFEQRKRGQRSAKKISEARGGAILYLLNVSDSGTESDDADKQFPAGFCSRFEGLKASELHRLNI